MYSLETDQPFERLAFSEDGNSLLTFTARAPVVVSVANGKTREVAGEIIGNYSRDGGLSNSQVAQIRNRFVSVEDAAISPNGSFVAVSTDAGLGRWNLNSRGFRYVNDADTGKRVGFYTADPIRLLHFLADSMTVVWLSGDDIARFYDIQTGRHVRDIVLSRTNKAVELAVSRDGSLLAASARHGRAFSTDVWSLADRTIVQSFGGSAGDSLSFSDDNTLFAMNNQLYDLDTGEPVMTINALRNHKRIQMAARCDFLLGMSGPKASIVRLVTY
jgi:WD40 repeat protein